MIHALRTRRVAAGIAVIAVAACGGNRDDDLDTTMAAGAVALPDTMSMAIAARDLPTTDGGVIDLLATIDSSEIQQGSLARTKAQNAAIKTFARMMIEEHRKDQRQLAQLVKNTSISGATRVGVSKGDTTAAPVTTQAGIFTTLQSMHDSTMARLQNATGIDFDRAYIDAQVTAHQEALDILQQLQTQVQSPQLSQHLSQVVTTVQRHLDRARELQNESSGTSADTAPTSNYRPRQ